MLILAFVACVLTVCSTLVKASPTPAPKPYNLEDEKNPEYWNQLAKDAIRHVRELKPIDHAARNAILFLGDGMGVSTLTAARILKGQIEGQTGEEGWLHLERFPYSALIKTYNVDHQVPDSAGTATAYLTGVKANLGVIGLDAKVNQSETDCSKIRASEVHSIMEMARNAGKAIGVVTTTRITHATPAGAYAHVADRDWEYDEKMPLDTRNAGCYDIAHQLIYSEPGRSLNVIFGGGRRNFLPAETGDRERKGLRTDKLNLIQEWKKHRESEGLKEDQFAYVETRQELNKLDFNKVKHVFGLFADNHLEYETVVAETQTPEQRKEPTLTEMTEAAVRILSAQPNGFVLLVEGGRIDHAHHSNQAKKALHETVEFDRAIDWAGRNLDHKDTLIAVTADHSHGFTISGYPTRGNNIFNQTGEVEKESGNPFTTLMYATGPGHRQPRWQASENIYSIEYQQYSAVKTTDANHGGEDVALYSRGPMAHLFRGLHEQNYIPHVMAFATCIGQYKTEAHCVSGFHPAAAAASKAWIYVVVVLIVVACIGFYYYRKRQS